MQNSTLTEEFSRALEKVSGKAHVAGSLEEAGRMLAGLLAEWGVGTIAIGELPEAVNAALRAFAAESGCVVLGPNCKAAELPLGLDSAEVGVTLAAFGIAETGTVAEVALDDAGRLVSAMPRTHVALLHARDLAPTLRGAAGHVRDVFARHGDGVALSFISGPSRTGDIEMVLTLGVHGPERMEVIVVDDGEAVA